RVMIGLNWGEHMAFLDEPGRIEEIEERIRTWIRSCAGHPAVFCYIIGNEIPASIVRWHGRRRVEKFIERLYRIAKEEDPDALVTYVNYPSTEYLRLPFLDFFCFNVYLESRDSFEDYLSRLHSLSEDRPVLLTEIGLDSLRGGDQRHVGGPGRFGLSCLRSNRRERWLHGRDRADCLNLSVSGHQRGEPRPQSSAQHRDRRGHGRDCGLHRRRCLPGPSLVAVPRP